jgi:taurine--2-oxoglutarate transaminase
VTSRSLFSWKAQRAVVPMRVVSGSGARFWTDDGREYLDLASVVFSANAGWQHPAILGAMRRQLDELALAGPAMAPPVRERAAAALAALLPGGDWRIFFALGGAEANEHAAKIAMMATGRSAVICRERSYHGATFGALSFSDDPRALALFPRLPGVVRVPEPAGDGAAAADAVEAALASAPAPGVAAVLMETVSGTRGACFPPDDYYRRVAASCARHDALLILDEVLAGFGRTGTTFAFERYGVVPDLVTMGKGITSGHAPLGAVAVREEIARRFDERPLVTGLTHTAHPVSLAALEGNLAALRRDRLAARAAALGEPLAAWLARAKSRSATIAAVRSRGLYGCVELAPDGDAGALARSALADGLHLVAAENRLFVAPPLVIGEDELADGLARLERHLPA